MSKAKFGTAAANIPHSAFRTPHSEIDTQPPFSDTWAPTEPIDRCSTCCLLPVPNGGYRNFYGCWRDVQRGWAFPWCRPRKRRISASLLRYYSSPSHCIEEAWSTGPVPLKLTI